MGAAGGEDEPVSEQPEDSSSSAPITFIDSTANTAGGSDEFLTMRHPDGRTYKGMIRNGHAYAVEEILAPAPEPPA